MLIYLSGPERAGPQSTKSTRVGLIKTVINTDQISSGSPETVPWQRHVQMLITCIQSAAILTAKRFAFKLHLHLRSRIWQALLPRAPCTARCSFLHNPLIQLYTEAIQVKSLVQVNNCSVPLGNQTCNL